MAKCSVCVDLMGSREGLCFTLYPIYEPRVSEGLCACVCALRSRCVLAVCMRCTLLQTSVSCIDSGWPIRGVLAANRHLSEPGLSD